MRRDRTFIAIDLFVSVFSTADHHLLIRHAHAVQLFEIMLPALDEHVAAARIHAVFNDRHFAAGFFPRRIFGAIDEAAEVTLFHPAEAVDLFFHVDSVAKGGQCGLRHREVNFMTGG
ncbi:Uncharacterised protein [Klebsiella pneumoniae]|nr:Uncharacterised protein [Klebsiella pneumoniae]